MRRHPQNILPAIIATLLFSLAPIDAPASQATGYNSLFIGHSFFRPFADHMDDHAADAGIEGHSQVVVFNGGGNGAPMALWNNASKRAEIQAALDTGEIELFGMTYHPDYPTTEGYKLWIDYALERNPETRFFIALPWSPYPAQVATIPYVDGWMAAHDASWHGSFLPELRALYPGVEIACNPYGRSAADLRLLLDAGELPEVSQMTGSASSSIYTDALGHAGDILKVLGRLVWLNAIYEVDLPTFDHDTGYTTDLKAVAQEIMDWHRAEFPYPVSEAEITSIRATRFLLKDDAKPPLDPRKRRFSFKSSTFKGNPSEVFAPAWDGDGDPTVEGATLTLYPSGGTSGEALTLELPASGWSRSGSSASARYFYDDKPLANGPIQKVRLHDGKLTITGKGAGLYSLNGAPHGSIAMRLALGDGIVFCAEAQPKAPAHKNDTAARFQGDRASAAPASCPPLDTSGGYGSASLAFLALPTGLLD